MAYIFGSIWDRFNRNALNDLSKSVEHQGKTIQDLVAEGQLTPEQYKMLIQSVNGLISKGDITLNDLKPDVLSAIEGGESTTFNLLSIPRDKSVTPDKTSFLSRINLFDGNPHRKRLDGSYAGVLSLASDDNARTAKVEVKPNTTYTVIRKPSDRFKIQSDTVMDREDREYLEGDVFYVAAGASDNYIHTFTTGPNDVVLYVFYSLTDEDILVQITEGAVNNFIIDSYDYAQPTGINVYNKQEIDGLIPTNKSVRNIIVKKSGINLDIYIPSKTTTNYMHYYYRNTDNPSILLNQWRVQEKHVVDENLNKLYSFRSGDMDGILKETGTPEAIGGLHGDERNIDLHVMLDNEVINIDSQDFTKEVSQEVRITNRSIMNRSKTENEDVIERYKTHVWNKENYSVENKFVFLEDMQLDRIAMTMFGVEYEHEGKQLATKGRSDKDHAVVTFPDMVETGSLEDDVRRLEIWGDDDIIWYMRAEADYDYGDKAQIYMANYPGLRVKLYFRTHQDQFVKAGTAIKGTSTYTFIV